MIPFLRARPWGVGDGVPLRVCIQGRDPKLHKYAREAFHIIIKMREGGDSRDLKPYRYACEALHIITKMREGGDNSLWVSRDAYVLKTTSFIVLFLTASSVV